MAAKESPELQKLSKLVEKLEKKETDIKRFHIIVQWIQEIESTSKWFNIGEDQTDDDKWEKVSQMFRAMGYTSDRYSADKCREKFYKWSEFYAKNYDQLEAHLEHKMQQIFDYLKIVHILDFNNLWSAYDWTHSLLKEISIKDEIYNYLNDLENKKLEIEPKERSNRKAISENDSLPEDDKHLRHLTESVREMVREEKDIEFFHSMVKMIDPKAVYWKNTFKKWKEFSKLLLSFGYSSDLCSPQRCKDVFYKWSAFYAQNYYKLNDNLEPEFQEIFNLLKIVHTLDIKNMWRSGDSTLLLLENIAKEDEITEYINESKKKSVNEVKDEIIVSKKSFNYESNSSEIWSTFEDMKLRKRLLNGITAYGLEKPSFIQQRAIVPSMRGKNVIAQAQSGTGKTAFFVIAILQRIDTSLDKCQALIMTPTRELAQQIQKVVMALGAYMRVKCQVCIGGTDVKDNVHKLRMGAQIMVGTSGRICDMIERGALRPETIEIFVVDEADHMLTGKHRQQFNDVFNLLGPSVQIILSSATMPKEVLQSTKEFMKNAIHILVNNEELTLEGIKQFYVNTGSEAFKFSAFCDLYDTINKAQAFVYCNTRDGVDLLTEQLNRIGIVATHIHGDMEQRERNAILRGFRAGFCRVLLTSDLLGRGIDVQQVSLVVNYDLPFDRQTYIHRVGRGGRFGRKGIAINLVTEEQMEDLGNLQMFYHTNIDELPTNLSELI